MQGDGKSAKEIGAMERRDGSSVPGLAIPVDDAAVEASSFFGACEKFSVNS